MYHRSLKSDVRDQLLSASAATIGRLLKPLRVQYEKGPCGAKPGNILRQEIPIRGGVWGRGSNGEGRGTFVSQAESLFVGLNISD